VKAWLVLSIVATGCLESPIVRCADGRICAAGYVCDELHDTCVLGEQLVACAGLAEDEPCAIAGEMVGVCQDGVCLHTRCGDGVVSGVEDCEGDDLRGVTDCRDLGFHDSGPVTCNARCQYETACTRRCGDGVVDPEEQCDVASGTRTADCRERGFYDAGDVTCKACFEDTSSCTGRCGDGILNGGEQCDGGESLTTCLELGFEAGRIACANCAADFTACKDIGWVPIGGGTTTTWRGLSSPLAGQVVASGANGSVIRLDRDGDATSSPIPGGGLVTAVWASGASAMHAVDEQPRIWSFDGAWSPQATTAPMFGMTNGWAVGDNRHVYQFGGTSWARVHDGAAGSGTLYAVSSTGADTFAVGTNGLVLRRNGGAWTAETTSTAALLAGVWGTGNDVFAVGTGGTILRRNATWQAMSSGTTASLTGVWGRAADDVYVTGGAGTLLHYDGASWWRLTTGTQSTLYAVHGNAGEAFAAGDNGVVLRHGGASWAMPTTLGGYGYDAVSIGPGGEIVFTSQCAIRRRGASGWDDLGHPCHPSDARYEAVWAGPGGVIVAVEFAGTTHRFDGQTWTIDPKLSAGAFGVADVWGTAADNVYVVSFDGVRHFDGQAWSQTSAMALYFGIHGTSASDIFAVGTEVQHFDGTAWTVMEGPTEVLNDVFAVAPNDVWAVGENGYITHYDGATWTTVPSGTTRRLLAVHGSGPTDLWAVGDNNTVLRFDGLGWSAVKSPLAGDAALQDVAVRDDLVVIAAGGYEVLALIREATW
jgi:hypothetical protein